MAEYAFFTDRSARVFRAAASRIIPSEPRSPGAGTEEVLRVADRMIASRPARDQKMLGLFLGVVERLPVLRYGKSFSKLTPERQDRVLDFLQNNRLSKFRQGFFGLKTFALMGYYGSDSCFTEIGYPGPRLDAPYYTLHRREGSE